MNKAEAEQFKGEMDSWIKGFKKDLSIFSSEIDDCTSEVNSHSEELQFHFDNICRLENKVDRLEDTFEKILTAIEISNALKQQKNQAVSDYPQFSNMQPLRDKVF